MTIDRQLRWNFQCEEHPPTFHFNFLIINDDRYINRIKQRIIQELQPVENVQELTEGKIKDDLMYKLISLDSYRENIQNINWKKIYDRTKQTFRDENLTNRKTKNGLANYIDNLIGNSKI
jgi:hypothetical protein